MSKKKAPDSPYYNGAHYRDPTAAQAIKNSDDDTLYCKVCHSTEKVDVLQLGIYGPQTPTHKTAEICLCRKCQKYFVDLFHSRVKKLRKVDAHGFGKIHS